MQLGCWCRCSFGVVAVRAHFCNIDGRVLGGMQFGVLVQVKLGGGGAEPRASAGACLRN